MSGIEPPVYCNIELTNACNLQCIMCSNREMKRSRGLMSSKLFTKVIEQVVEAQIPKVNLATIGEPLLHPECISFIEQCKREGLFVLLSTNFQLADETLIEQLIDSGLDVLSLSIEGTSKEEYESIRKGGDFERLQRNVGILKSKRQDRKHCPEVVIRSVQFPEHISQSRFISCWKDFCNRFEFPSVGNQGGYLTSMPVKIDWHDEARIPCRLLWNSLSVTYEGYISFCCVDFENEMLLGDIDAESIRTVWYGNDYAGLREMHEKCDFRGLPHCQVCSSTFEHWLDFPTIYKR